LAYAQSTQPLPRFDVDLSWTIALLQAAGTALAKNLHCSKEYHEHGALGLARLDKAHGASSSLCFLFFFLRRANMARTTTDSSVAALINAFVSAFDVFKKLKRKRGKKGDRLRDEETRLSKSLRRAPGDLRVEYERNQASQGERFREGDSEKTCPSSMESEQSDGNKQ
jgi:hypothetical protein